MRRGVLVSVIVLASLLLGALAAGTPVAGNDSVAAMTAGIELGTAPVVRAPTASTVQRLGSLRAVATIVRALTLLVAATAVTRWIVRASTPPDPSTLLRHSTTRRGPPALA